MSDTGPGSLIDVKPVTGMEAFDDGNATAVKVTFKSTRRRWRSEPVVHRRRGGSAGPAAQGRLADHSVRTRHDGHPAEVRPDAGATTIGVTRRPCDVAGARVRRGLPGLRGARNRGRHSIPASTLTTLGNNMIDAARAARRVLPTASSQWAAYGIGEGGLAAWAAAERAGTYGAGMDLVGAVAISPYANMSPLVDAAERGELERGRAVPGLHLDLAERRQHGPRLRPRRLPLRGGT